MKIYEKLGIDLTTKDGLLRAMSFCKKEVGEVGEKCPSINCDDCVADYLFAEVPEEKKEHDGCLGCVHEYLGSEFVPCKYCKRNFADKYVCKPKKTVKRWETYEGNFLKAQSEFDKYSPCKDYGECICSEDTSCQLCFAKWLMEETEK